MHILVVDDEPDIRATTQMLLECHGYTVTSAANGADAVEVAAKSPPDAVLLDLNMPVMDGFTAARRLREMPEGSTLLIVAVSAYVSNREWCDRALAAGVDECIAKPLDYSRLEALLSSHQKAGRS